MSSSQQAGNRDQEKKSTVETAALQVVHSDNITEQAESALKREAELQAKRDSDARAAEDTLRRERDLKARSAIDAAIKDSAAQVTNRIISDVKSLTDQTIVKIRENTDADIKRTIAEAEGKVSQTIQNIEKQFTLREELITNEIGKIVSQYKSKIEATLKETTDEIKINGKTRINTIVNELKVLAERRIDTEMDVLHTEARNAERIARDERNNEFKEASREALRKVISESSTQTIKAKTIISSPVETVEKVAANIQTSTDNLFNAQKQQIELVSEWSERVSQKQRNLLKAGNVFEAMDVQRDILMDNTRTAIDLCFSFMSISSQYGQKLSQRSF